MQKKSLGDRMKGYENVPRNYLMTRVPVIIRLDGKAFHTYTRHFTRPFSDELHILRKATLEYLVNNIQGCVFGYSQSDEISLFLKDWQTFNTDAWFDNNIQKMVSVSASMCTGRWNLKRFQMWDKDREVMPVMAEFDSRVWNIPKEEVVNYFIWRQQDWERNSVQMLAGAYYSRKQLHGVNCKKMLTMLEVDHGIIWGDLASWKKQGEIYFRGIDSGIETDFIFKNKRDIIEALIDGTTTE